MTDSKECKCEENRNNNCERDMRRQEMIDQIKSLDFAIIELGLYLDTHPDDQRALCMHREYCKQTKDLKDKYQKMYGPLTIFYPCNKWRWLEQPWPWERGNY
jgi:spore coat protein JB